MAPMTTETDRPAEGDLIEKARKEVGLSQNAAARAAGISGTRWRQIVNGYGTTSGMRVPVTGPATTVARMAQAVGVSANDLAEAGRSDAAKELSASAAPLAALAEEWDGHLTGPSGVVEEGELLMWRDEPDGRVYRLADADDPDVHTQYRFGPGEPPEDVIEDLRGLLEPYRVHVQQMARRRAKR